MNTLFPHTPAAKALTDAQAIDIREPHEREGASEAVLAIPNVPMAEWHRIPERFPDRPLVLCCAAGVRTRMCVELLNHPDDIHAWTGSIHEWVRECEKGSG